MDYTTHFACGEGRLALCLFFFFIEINTITITTATTAHADITNTTNRADRPAARPVISNKTKI